MLILEAAVWGAIELHCVSMQQIIQLISLHVGDPCRVSFSITLLPHCLSTLCCLILYFRGRKGATSMLGEKSAHTHKETYHSKEDDRLSVRVALLCPALLYIPFFSVSM